MTTRLPHVMYDIRRPDPGAHASVSPGQIHRFNQLHWSLLHLQISLNDFNDALNRSRA